MNVVSVLFKPLYNGYLSTTATIFCPEGHRCGEVQLLKKTNTHTDTHSATDLIGLLLLAVCLARGGGGYSLI